MSATAEMHMHSVYWRTYYTFRQKEILFSIGKRRELPLGNKPVCVFMKWKFWRPQTLQWVLPASLSWGEQEVFLSVSSWMTRSVQRWPRMEYHGQKVNTGTHQTILLLWNHCRRKTKSAPFFFVVNSSLGVLSFHIFWCERKEPCSGIIQLSNQLRFVKGFFVSVLGI